MGLWVRDQDTGFYLGILENPIKYPQYGRMIKKEINRFMRGHTGIPHITYKFL